MDAIQALAGEIGPRASCSKEERRAAEWCAARLSDEGYEVTTEPFASRPSYMTWFAGYIVLSIAGALLILPLPGVAALLGLTALVLYARDADGRPLLAPRGGTSHNVVARPRGRSTPEAVVMAHVDSARSSLSFHPKTVSSLRASTFLLNLALGLVPALGAAAWVAEAGRELPSSLWVPVGILVAYLTFAAGLLLHGRFRMPVVAGANDNASGVEVLVRLARMSWDGRVWFVVTGSEEVGMVGAQAFLAAHGHEVAHARFLNIDNVGAGTLVAASEEGSLRERRCDRFMLDVAEEAGATGRPYRALPTDATALLARKLRALTLIAVNDDGVPENWHWTSDTIPNIDPAALDRATGVARSVIDAVVTAQVGP